MVLNMLRALHSAASNMECSRGVHSFKILSDFSQNVKLYIFVYGRTTNYRWLWLKTAHIPTLDQRRRHGCIFFTLPCHLVRDVVPCFLVHSHPSCLCYRCHACLVLSMQSINLLVFCFPIWPPEGGLGYMSCDNLLMCSKSSILF